MQAADMEQRHSRQRGGWIAAVDHHADTLGRTHGAKRALEIQGKQRLADCPVTGHDALGAAGGAGGVEDQRWCARIYFQRWYRLCGGADQVLETQAVLGQGRILSPDDDRGALLAGQVFTQGIEARFVAQQQARTAVLQRVLQLVAQAPTVERHTHRAAALDRREGHQPCRLVAHGNRYPIARLHTKIGNHLPGQAVDLVEVLVEGQALRLPHQKFAIAVDSTGVDDLQQVVGGVTEVAWSAVIGRHHFKRRTGGDQLAPRGLPAFNAHFCFLQNGRRTCGRGSAFNIFIA
ncbi:hypothetical protein D3C76_1086190 [compost metagenome]